MNAATTDVRAAATRVKALVDALPKQALGEWHNPEPDDAWNCLIEAGVQKLGTVASKELAVYVAAVASPPVALALVDLLTAVARCDCEDDDCLAVLSCAEVLADRLGAE